MTPVRRRLVFACSVLVIAGSLVIDIPWSTAARQVRQWDASEMDPADYRITAEHFWGVRSDPSTYTYGPMWRPEWESYLLTVPFRQIGTGTAYVVAGWLRLGHAPQTISDVAKAGHALIQIEKLAMALGLLAVFAATLDGFGVVAAFIVLFALAFPPRMWRLTEDMLTEPLLRIVLLFLFAAIVRLTSRRHARSALAAMVLMFLAVQIKVQWIVTLLLLAAPIAWVAWIDGRRRLAAAVGAIALAAPLSVMAVNMIGWGTLSLSAGTGVHVHIKYGDDVLKAFCATRTSQPSFCDLSGPRLHWWNAHFGTATREDWEAFDRFAVRDLLAHPGRSAVEFIDGLALASTLPGTEAVADTGLRFTDYPMPWEALAGFIDHLCWTMMLVGLWLPRTRLIAWCALVMWIVPAAGNVAAVYELRYHQPMAGFALAAAALVAFECRHWITLPSLLRPPRGRHALEHP